ncbi:AraC family transcriptional regulator [Rhizobacter sp. P5_C2]
MRPQSELSYRRRINRVVAHVHAHLASDLEGGTLADIAAMSRFHFHRVFSAMTGMTPAQYVLRMRLAAAVEALRGGSEPVGQIALDCGFDGGTSFARALRREFGLSPSAVRTALVDPRLALPVVASHRPSRRKTMLEPTFRDLPERQVLCATERGAIDNDMSAAAQRAFGRLLPAVQALGLGERQTACLAICPDEVQGFDDPDARFIAAIAFSGPVPDLSTVDRIDCQAIPAGRWAVFRHTGPYDTLWQTWRAIYRDWVPSSGLELRDAAPFEGYVNDASRVPAEALITDIHIPVR